MSPVPSRSPGQAHASVDGNLKRCRVLKVNPTARTATVIDRFGTIFDVSIQYVTGGGYPAKEDYWIMSNPFGRWCFLYKENPTIPLQYGQIVFHQGGTLTSHVGIDLPAWTASLPFAVTLTRFTITLNGSPSQDVTVKLITANELGNSRVQRALLTVPALQIDRTTVPLSYTMPANYRVLSQITVSAGDGKDLTAQVDYSFDTTVPAG